MTNAGIDQNGKSTILGTLNSDGVTIVPIKANPTNHGLKIDDNTTGSDAGNNLGNANIDENGKPVLTALSSAGDGTIVEVYTDVNGNLLINSK